MARQPISFSSVLEQLAAEDSQLVPLQPASMPPPTRSAAVRTLCSPGSPPQPTHAQPQKRVHAAAFAPPTTAGGTGRGGRGAELAGAGICTADAAAAAAAEAAAEARSSPGPGRAAPPLTPQPKQLPKAHAAAAALELHAPPAAASASEPRAAGGAADAVCPPNDLNAAGGAAVCSPTEVESEEDLAFYGRPLMEPEDDQFDFYGRPLVTPHSPPPSPPGRKKIYRCGMRTFVGQRQTKGVRVLQWLDSDEVSADSHTVWPQ